MQNVGGPNHLFSIDEVYVFISQDDKGNEGVCGFHNPQTNTFMPMVAADEARVAQLRPIAQQLVANDPKGHKIKLCRFSTRSEIEVFEKSDESD